MSDPLEDRLRRLRPSVIPEDVKVRLANPPPRDTVGRGKIIRVSFASGLAAAAAAIAVAIYWQDEPVPLPGGSPASVFADNCIRRVENVQALTVVAEGQRAWEVVEVQWVDETTLTAGGDTPLAMQASTTHRTIVPVEIALE
jgi:hypothetical protein